MVVPTHPGDYVGTTHTHKFWCKKSVWLYTEFKEHIPNSVKVFTDKFEKSLLLDLEDTQDLVVGFTAIQIYDHIYDTFFLPIDIAREITKTGNDLKIIYNLDDIV